MGPHTSSTNKKCNRSLSVYGIRLFGPPSPPPSCTSGSTRIGLCYRRIRSPLLLHDALLIQTDRMTSRLFLNLRSAGSSTSNLTQSQLVTAIPLSNRQAMSPEYTQATSSRTLTAGNLDSTLFAMVSGVDQSVRSEQEQPLSWDATEAKPSMEAI